MIATFAKIIDVMERFPEDIKENTIRMRIKDPSGFQKDSFRTISLTSGIKAIIGKPNGSNKTEIQSIIFDKKKYTPEKARKWLSKHKSRFSEALDFETKKRELFSEEITSENITDSFKDHLENHFPKLTETGIQKIFKMAGITQEDILDYSGEEYEYTEEELKNRLDEINKSLSL